MKRLEVLILLLVGLGGAAYFVLGKNKLGSADSCQAKTITLSPEVKEYIDSLLKEKQDSVQSKKIQELSEIASSIETKWAAVQVWEKTREENSNLLNDFKARIEEASANRFAKREQQRDSEYQVLREKIAVDCQAIADRRNGRAGGNARPAKTTPNIQGGRRAQAPSEAEPSEGSDEDNEQ